MDIDRSTSFKAQLSFLAAEEAKVLAREAEQSGRPSTIDEAVDGPNGSVEGAKSSLGSSPERIALAFETRAVLEKLSFTRYKMGKKWQLVLWRKCMAAASVDAFCYQRIDELDYRRKLGRLKRIPFDRVREVAYTTGKREFAICCADAVEYTFIARDRDLAQHLVHNLRRLTGLEPMNELSPASESALTLEYIGLRLSQVSETAARPLLESWSEDDGAGVMAPSTARASAMAPSRAEEAPAPAASSLQDSQPALDDDRKPVRIEAVALLNDSPDAEDTDVEVAAVLVQAASAGDHTADASAPSEASPSAEASAAAPAEAPVEALTEERSPPPDFVPRSSNLNKALRKVLLVTDGSGASRSDAAAGSGRFDPAVEAGLREHFHRNDHDKNGVVRPLHASHRTAQTCIGENARECSECPDGARGT